MTADTSDIAKLAAEMRARAEVAQPGRWCLSPGPKLISAHTGASSPDNVLAILDALARADARADRAEQERDAAREMIGRLCEALEPFGGPYAHPDEPDHWPVFGKQAGQGWPTVGDVRRAARVLASVREGGADGEGRG